MKEIIAPVSVDAIISELTADKFIRSTNYGGNQIYTVNHKNAPNIMREIGRLREEAFRQAGGGSGKDADIDAYDLADEPYQQLIVWDPHEQAILGGYRYKLLRLAERDANGNYILATGKLFEFTNTFTDQFLPHTLELGRSFVQPQYQASKMGRKSLFALDNLWDGIGSLIVRNPDVKYLFGKVTMYRHYNQRARDLLLFFMAKYCPDPDRMLYPKVSLEYHTDISDFEALFHHDSYLENYKTMVREVRKLGENVPPLINAYLNISPSMRSFGGSINEAFGGVEETGILVTVADIYQAIRDRHVKTYDINEAQPPVVQ